MKSYTKIRQMQELNKIAEKRFIQESKQRIEPLNEGMKAYSEAISQLKGINQGFLETVKSA